MCGRLMCSNKIMSYFWTVILHLDNLDVRPGETIYFQGSSQTRRNYDEDDDDDDDQPPEN